MFIYLLYKTDIYVIKTFIISYYIYFIFKHIIFPFVCEKFLLLLLLEVPRVSICATEIHTYLSMNTNYSRATKTEGTKKACFRLDITLLCIQFNVIKFYTIFQSYFVNEISLWSKLYTKSALRNHTAFQAFQASYKLFLWSTKGEKYYYKNTKWWIVLWWFFKLFGFLFRFQFFTRKLKLAWLLNYLLIS